MGVAKLIQSLEESKDGDGDETTDEEEPEEEIAEEAPEDVDTGAEGLMEETGIDMETAAMIGAGVLGVAALGALAALAMAGMGGMSEDDLLRKKIEMLKDLILIEAYVIDQFQETNGGTRDVKTEFRMLAKNINVQTGELRKQLDFSADRIGEILQEKQDDEEDMLDD